MTESFTAARSNAGRRAIGPPHIDPATLHLNASRDVAVPIGPTTQATASSPGFSRPVGRPPAAIDIARVQELSALGLNIDQIAHRLGIGERTLFDRFTRDPAVRRAFDEGRAEATEIIARRLQQMGLDENNLGALIFWLKTKGGFTAPKETTVTIAAQPIENIEPFDTSHVREMAERQRNLAKMIAAESRGT